ncbi:sensor histidine kinase [Galactobacter caseinivorans]|uniref:histidine kinase n=1 Tax=Galactobacter caseinivorans TaxID=2676123 RepID=A0A496PFK6_9MICC|nr:HAMP domain-containing sensor histidine kinase [Galactobacter caseinivorans]RKW69509.1 sensor histidine kinase [Galactobacter caseinivorans]
MTRLFRHISLRTKLVALMAALMMAGILATAWATAQSTKAALVGQIDVDLRAAYTDLGSAMQTAVAKDRDAIAPAGGRTADFYASLYDTSGELLFAKPAYANTRDTPAVGSVTPAVVSQHKRAPFTVRGTDPGSRGWRVLVVPASGDAGSVLVAWPLQDTTENVERATASILLTGTLATMVMSLIGYAVTTRSFRPLRRVERTAASIAQGNLSGRIEEFPIETEVGRLSYSLNAMLAQIEAAFRAKAASETKMRRFIQDASHELRTPLVTIRGYSELYRHGGIPAGEPLDQSMGRIEAEAKRMTQLVEDLLTLARLDEERPLEPAPVDLLVLANDAVADARVNAPDRVVRLVGVDGNPPESAPTVGDEPKLRQVVVNLMTNALRYTPEGTPIEVAVGVRPVISGRSDSVIALVDHGDGIPPADAQRIFERFYRADSSRQRETGGTGLGLAIVAAIAKQHDGGIRLTDTPGGGATMSLHVPYVPQEPEPDTDAADAADVPDDAASPSTRPLALLRNTFTRRASKEGAAKDSASKEGTAKDGAREDADAKRPEDGPPAV